jgi:hypothetical protein
LLLKTEPPTEVRSPSVSAARAASLIASTDDVRTSAVCTGYWTWTIAVVRSAETAPEACGSTTALTWGARSASATVRAMAAVYGASVIRCPSGAVKTIWALAPEASGRVLLRLSNARCDSVPGTEKRSSSLPPKTPTHVMSAASTKSHIPRTSFAVPVGAVAQPVKQDGHDELPRTDR